MFRESADLRRDVSDYTGMARALALAGEAADRTGRAAEAADLYFRAGRSAEAEDHLEDARRWLTTAVRLGRAADRPDLVAQARELLRRVNTRS